MLLKRQTKNSTSQPKIQKRTAEKDAAEKARIAEEKRKEEE